MIRTTWISRREKNPTVNVSWMILQNPNTYVGAGLEPAPSVSLIFSKQYENCSFT
jgi:hypothetical protein